MKRIGQKGKAEHGFWITGQNEEKLKATGPLNFGSKREEKYRKKERGYEAESFEVTNGRRVLRKCRWKGYGEKEQRAPCLALYTKLAYTIG